MKFDIPDGPRCRCGLRLPCNQCLDSRTVIRNASPAALAIEAGSASDYRERRYRDSSRASRGMRRMVRS